MTQIALEPMSRLETPAITSPVDAEVDVEVLRSVPKTFAIESMESANWLVRKIVAARIYAERIRTWTEQELRRAVREEQTLLFMFGRQLENWAKGEIAGLHNRKSLALPAGTVGFRMLNPKLVIDDEQVVLEWARRHCAAAVVSTERLAKSLLDEHVQKTGEIPEDGAHIDPGGEKFFIK